MNHWSRSPEQRKAAWEYLRGLETDYALLQEIVPPRDWPPNRLVFRKMEYGGRTQWGSAVVSYDRPIQEVSECLSPHGKKAHRFHLTFPGTLAIAQIASDIVLVSVYGMIDNGYAVTTVHRLLSDLTPLLDSKLGRRVILAGDLNVSTQLPEPDRKRHRNLLERFATVGLVDCLDLERPARQLLRNCPCEDIPCRHVHTHRHGRSGKPWQNDYMFVSKPLSSRVVSCRPVNEGDSIAWSHSDHRPLVLEIREGK